MSAICVLRPMRLQHGTISGITINGVGSYLNIDVNAVFSLFGTFEVNRYEIHVQINTAGKEVYFNTSYSLFSILNLKKFAFL